MYRSYFINKDLIELHYENSCECFAVAGWFCACSGHCNVAEHRFSNGTVFLHGKTLGRGSCLAPSRLHNPIRSPMTSFWWTALGFVEVDECPTGVAAGNRPKVTMWITIISTDLQSRLFVLLVTSLWGQHNIVKVI